MAPIALCDTIDLSPELAALGEAAFDLEPEGGAPLVGFLLGRPSQQHELSLSAVQGDAIVGWAIGSQCRTTGFIDAIAVDPAHRRRGIATALLDELESRLVAHGADDLAVGGNAWYYAWPGVDGGYLAAHALLERRGYRVTDWIRNMDVDLDRDFLMPSAPLASLGGPLSLRRATSADGPALTQFAAREFPDTPWQREVLVALDHEPPGVHIGTLPDGRIVGFGCHGTYRPDWFGPLGIAAEVRGAGLGESLLRCCLTDLAAAGHSQAQICWIGPAGFYARTVGARCRRVFTVFRRTANGSPGADSTGDSTARTHPFRRRTQGGEADAERVRR